MKAKKEVNSLVVKTRKENVVGKINLIPNNKKNKKE